MSTVKRKRSRRDRKIDPIDRYLARSKRKQRRRILIGLIIIIVLLGGGYYYFMKYRPGQAYEQARELYEQGNYVRAIDAFSNLGDYDDSKYMYEKCVKNLIVSYCDMQDFERALSVSRTYDTEADTKEIIEQAVWSYVEARCSEHAYSEALEYVQYGDQDALKELITKSQYKYVTGKTTQLSKEELSILKELASKDYEDSLYYLGKYYQDKGNDAQTKREYNKYLYSHPNSKYKEEIEEVIAKISEKEDKEELHRVMEVMYDRWSDPISFEDGTIRFYWSDDTMVSAHIEDDYGERNLSIASYNSTTVKVVDSDNEVNYTAHYLGKGKYNVDVVEKKSKKKKSDSDDKDKKEESEKDDKSSDNDSKSSEDKSKSSEDD